jgi:hypothetical protein
VVNEHRERGIPGGVVGEMASAVAAGVVDGGQGDGAGDVEPDYGRPLLPGLTVVTTASAPGRCLM